MLLAPRSFAPLLLCLPALLPRRGVWDPRLAALLPRRGVTDTALVLLVLRDGNGLTSSVDMAAAADPCHRLSDFCEVYLDPVFHGLMADLLELPSQ